MDQRSTSNSLISRRSFLRLAVRGGTAAVATICAVSLVGPTIAAAAPQHVAALPLAQQMGPKASGKRDNVARNRTLIAENISGRNANPENFNPYIVNIVLHTGLQQACI